MKVVLLSQADALGGAARAAFRLHTQLLKSGEDSWMRVAQRLTDDPKVVISQSKFSRLTELLRPRIAGAIMRAQKTKNPVQHSLACLPSKLSSSPLVKSADVVNLHWVGHEFMSIGDIAAIDRPVVWTLHDMWAFCGAEHLSDGLTNARFLTGYDRGSRPSGHDGLDLDRWIFNRKRKAWTRPQVVVTPSRWLAECAQRSALMRDWPIRVVPNPLPVDVYRPLDKFTGRRAFRLPAKAPLVLFGALGGAENTIKGADLLWAALRKLAHLRPDCQAVIVGQSKPAKPPQIGMPLHYVGKLADDQSLALLYSAVDVVVIPSRIENLPQAGTEAQACGTPVVAFDVAGLPDVVAHQETGFLAKPYDPIEIAEGVAWVLEDTDRLKLLGEQARHRAVSLWAPAATLPLYLEAYESAQSLYESGR
ncbi:glycosyltransferase [Erythrobacter aquimaris]|uniref:Glycosyltransferase n=1 Tax=Qipengyuania aquimaris TaxID=255984 RepID=A0A6I4TLE5_9SPHN|nr:glycosyltransferase [Qipengyuania aquimaris]MXO95861.1 glycosyltransferase [Qipengyuania aquimaris]